MSAHRNENQPQDASRTSLSDTWEIDYWTTTLLRMRADRLKEVVHDVRTSVNMVSGYRPNKQ